MSYQVLARKWRPQVFAEVVGQQHVLTALTNGLALGRIHHAYLFSGTRGVGKTSIARLLAKGLNCETGITATPCGECDGCRAIEQGRFVDLLEIDAASRTKVEDTRELLDNVQYAPTRGRFKVYLIDEVHMLSRHSFNALLKTLEEPPAHVKFLLATTEPQKLPITILSRCLQFHLRALDVEQIQRQLEKITQAESIQADARALHLLARAAEGSMRDALSLTDQAIALGNGLISREIVTQMLGILESDQAVKIIEGLVAADGEKVMHWVSEVASHGIAWDNVFSEILSLLHRIAMLQLLSQKIGSEVIDNEQRLRELARCISPEDLQLFYQIILNGRQELAYAPDQRMGLEMTLLRALAFHPKRMDEALLLPVAPPDTSPEVFVSTTTVTGPEEVNGALIQAPIASPGIIDLPETTAQLLQARKSLRQKQREENEEKKHEVAGHERPIGSASERLVAKGESKPIRQDTKASCTAEKKEAYRWQAPVNTKEQATGSQQATNAQALRNALEYEKNPELAAKIVEETVQRDAWSAEVQQLTLPKRVEQLVLNAFREPSETGTVLLHFRPTQRHLNSPSAQQTLSQALSEHYDHPIKLVLVEDEDPLKLTPLEWRQKIYHEKLEDARQSIAADSNVQALKRLFDAEVDEESIRPV